MTNNKLKELADRLKGYRLSRKISIMEVCGTHTREFFRTGVKGIFPEGLSLVDGPGCPVCVTPNDFLDRAIEIGKRYNPVIATFGDMIHVPSSYSSLGREKAGGMRIEIVYSPSDALEMAEQNPDTEVIFLSLGFETTAPSEAVTVKQAMNRNIRNFSLLSGNKITVPAVSVLLNAREVNIDGFILPGHVSAIIGADAWKFVADVYHKPGVVAGFEDHDLILGTLLLLDLITKGKNEISNGYGRAVKSEGNLRAMEIMYEVFQRSDSNWRGIGVIPGSGLALREIYADFDAVRKFPVTPPEPKEHPGCRCGELLRGIIIPTECPLFDRGCSPEHPLGPCMVSSEGPCSAYYRYGRS